MISSHVKLTLLFFSSNLNKIILSCGYIINHASRSEKKVKLICISLVLMIIEPLHSRGQQTRKSIGMKENFII